ncbi:MAG: lipocalin-like domain-containing protein [Chloroflexota bacterium]
MWRYFVVLAVVFAVAVIGFSLVDTGSGDVSAEASIDTGTSDLSAFAQAVDPWDWAFPRDHGAHPDFQTEWWYYTGNLSAADGRRFGFQFTIFRRAIDPRLTGSASEWRTGQVYMAHFTLSDIEAGRFLHGERYSRGGADLAGAQPIYGEPATYGEPYRVWLEDWQVMATDPTAENLRITAASVSSDGTPFAVDLALEQVKPPALQGQGGLSPKSDEIGNASYYYTLSRLLTEGTLTIGDETFTVSGRTWMDHEFSTSALGENALGWDWFGLISDDDHELMVGQIRLTDGGREPAFGGLMIYPDGSTRYLPSETFTITPLDTWDSPHTGATYPSGWTITIDAATLEAETDFEITVMPLMRDQELHSGDIAYWEGAVRMEGSATGYGYAELTGYVDEMTGRF